MADRQQITRRTALHGILTGAAACAGLSRFPYAAQRATAGTWIETQSTGAEIWQVTTENLDQSNIYGELPYCSHDSRYFVYARRDPNFQMNRTEFMVVPQNKQYIWNRADRHQRHKIDGF